MQFEVTYKVYDDSSKRTSSGPSQYTMVVDAINQPAAADGMVNRTNVGGGIVGLRRDRRGVARDRGGSRKAAS